MKLVNLTPHPIHFFAKDGSVEVIPPSGTVARISSERKAAGSLSFNNKEIPLFQNKLSDQISGLPEPEDGTYYIVSALVGSAVASYRTDILMPDTSPDGVVRDSSGNIIGVKNFLIP